MGNFNVRGIRITRTGAAIGLRLGFGAWAVASFPKDAHAPEPFIGTLVRHARTREQLGESA